MTKTEIQNSRESLEINPVHLIYDKGCEQYCGEKTAFSSCAGKTEQLQVKNKIRMLPNTMYKSKLKMD